MGGGTKGNTVKWCWDSGVVLDDNIHKPSQAQKFACTKQHDRHQFSFRNEAVMGHA